jgi:C4-dicarboxylate-specific signal transduction histidine kinase
MRNAVEAMADSERRELTVATGRVGRMVEIVVADSGPGLPESDCLNLS